MPDAGEQLPQVKAAIRFIRKRLEHAEIGTANLRELVKAFDADPSLERAYCIAAALDLHAEFADFLARKMHGLTSDPIYHLTLDELNELQIEDLDLGTRPFNRLKRANYNMVWELVAASRDEVAAIPGLGDESLDEIESVLADYGLVLGIAIN